MFDLQEIKAKQQDLLQRKHIFDIEISSRCNKICSVCPRHAFTRKQTIMSTQIFNTLLQWLPAECHVMFAGFGEPLLNNEIFAYIRKIKSIKPQISISVYTNGILLNNNTIKKLLDSGLDWIQLSITDEQGFVIAQKALEFLNSTNQSDILRINVLYKDDNNLCQLQEKVSQLFPSATKLFHFKKIHNRGGFLYDYDHREELKTCGTFFMDTFIDAEGNIQICSNDINGINKIANIQEMSFAELIEMKKKFLGNTQISPLCKKCSDEYRVLHFKEV